MESKMLTWLFSVYILFSDFFLLSFGIQIFSTNLNKHTQTMSSLGIDQMLERFEKEATDWLDKVKTKFDSNNLQFDENFRQMFIQTSTDRWDCCFFLLLLLLFLAVLGFLRSNTGDRPLLSNTSVWCFSQLVVHKREQFPANWSLVKNHTGLSPFFLSGNVCVFPSRCAFPYSFCEKENGIFSF